MSRDLAGATAVLTRRPEDNAALAARLRGLGASVVEIPCVRTEPLAEPRDLAGTLARLGPDDVLVLTSRAAVEAVAPLGPRCPVAAVGSATAERARAAGLRVGFVPSLPDAVTLARELPLPRGLVVLARSDLAAAEPAAILRERGADVRDVLAYRTIARVSDPEALRAALRADRPIVFVASPSAVDAIASAAAPEDLRRAEFVAIGPRTARRVAERAGITAREEVFA